MNRSKNRLQTIPWTRLIEQAQQHSPAVVEDLMQAKQDFEHHDLHIIVPVSPLVRPWNPEEL
ncbi:MAG: hypothetical protein RBT80_00655 [Candidatus Vecturithrix sp.]|nr:hypothetical protein [Candidatus Vecturithrix sp.]